MARKLKVGIIQQANTPDLHENLMNLARSIEACASHGAELVVLQELHNTLYFCQTENTRLFDLAEPIPGPSTGFFSELAASLNIVLVTSLFEKRAPGLYHNTAVVFDKDGVTIDGMNNTLVSNQPMYLNDDVTVKNIKFTAPTNNNDNASNVYASGLSGNLTIENCTFTETQWDSIQITPVDGAEIVIKDCTFSNTSTKGQRYIHVQADMNADCDAKVTIVDNKFGSSNMMSNSLIDVDYIDYKNNLTVSGNTFEDSKDDIINAMDIYVCDTTGAYWNFSDAYDAFTK